MTDATHAPRKIKGIAPLWIWSFYLIVALIGLVAAVGVLWLLVTKTSWFVPVLIIALKSVVLGADEGTLVHV